jgi:hypothetical protein
MFDDTIPRTSNLESGRKFRQQKRATDSKDHSLSDLLRRPRYSLPLAYTLGVSSRLAYEDVEVIKYELDRAGFDVENTFRPIAYKVRKRSNVFYFTYLILRNLTPHYIH